MRKDKQKTSKNRNRNGHGARDAQGKINYHPVRLAGALVTEWAANLVADDIKGWREGVRDVCEVRDYLCAKLLREPGHEKLAEPSSDAALVVATQLARTLMRDPRIVEAVSVASDALAPLVPLAIELFAAPRPPAAARDLCPMRPVVVRPPGVPLTVATPIGVATRPHYVHLHRA